jgi:excisionase family DNA binding protein
MSERLLTVLESAQRLSLSPATLRKWIFQRRLKCVRLGRAVRLKESEVDAIARLGFRPEASEP